MPFGNRGTMTIYYRLDTSGDETNLQVYSLHQAAKNWNELIDEIEQVGIDNVSDLKEKLVFILSCLGLSLSHLIRQNWPSPEKEDIDAPGTLLGSILKTSKIDRNTCKRLNKGFQDFLGCYGAIRHFGLNKDATTYTKVDDITFSKLCRFKDLTVQIWDTILMIFKRNDENDLQDIASITDAVWFKDIAEPEERE